MLSEAHPDTLQSANSLAMDLYSRDLEQAEELHCENLALHERMLGEEHPSTLEVMYSLARPLSIRHRFVEAEALYKKAISGYQKVLGSDHPKTVEVERIYSEL